MKTALIAISVFIVLVALYHALAVTTPPSLVFQH